MRALVIGAGMMGSAAAHDLARSPGLDGVIVADQDGVRAEAVASKLGPRVTAVSLDVACHNEVVRLMGRVDGAITATSYRHNLDLTRAAIEAGIHLCDLGGNMEVVHAQLALDADARAADVLVLPNCGVAPGLACVVAAGAAAQMPDAEAVRIRVGGLPLRPRPPLGYQLLFSAEGLLNEYLEPAEVLRDGRIVEERSLDGLETLELPEPFGALEAFNTSGGASTLTSQLEGRVKELDYKTIRYPGHCMQMRLLLELGLAGSEPVATGSAVTRRAFLEDLLREKLAASEPDVMLMRVTAEGPGGALVYELIEHQDAETGITAMARTTAFPTSVILQLALDGTLEARGVQPPERCVPLAPLLERLSERGIVVTTRRG